MYSSIFVNFLIYVHICSSQIVFPSNFRCVITTRDQLFSYAVVSNYPSNQYFPCFLLHKISVEYTRLYFSIAEVLFYTVEPRIPCNDFFSKCWIIESNPVGS